MNILISPLNWGIGHATRLVPIIKYLQKKHKIILTADGNSLKFLNTEFPELTILSAPSLNVRYTKNSRFLPLKILSYLPKFIIFYFENYYFVKKIEKSTKIDLIIADNRFGFFSKRTKSVFITHQIKIKARNKIMQDIIFIINKINIEQFNECWIADNPKKFNLSGELSDCSKIKIPCKKIGILSRFPTKKTSNHTDKYEIIAIISGPEPQRTILQNKITEILLKTNKKSLIISGLLASKKIKKLKNITIVNHLNTSDFQQVILNSEIIISRAGYSSIMDLVTLKKTAILIPTPEQTEQEYLANYLHKNKLFYTVEQNMFNKNTIFTFNNYKQLFQKNILQLENSTVDKFLNEQIK